MFLVKDSKRPGANNNLGGVYAKESFYNFKCNIGILDALGASHLWYDLETPSSLIK